MLPAGGGRVPDLERCQQRFTADPQQRPRATRHRLATAIMLLDGAGRLLFESVTSLQLWDYASP